MKAILKQCTEQAHSNTQQNYVGIAVLFVGREIYTGRFLSISYKASFAKNAATQSVLL